MAERDLHMTSTTMIAQTAVEHVKGKRINWRKQGVAYLFLLPALIIFALVTWYPLFNTILYSFERVNVAGVQGWVGLRNYERMFGNPIFWLAWKNTLTYVLLSLVMG